MQHREAHWFGHPGGLFLLFTTEMFERFSYHGMRAILVLYLTDTILHGGMGWPQHDTLQLYGIYTGLTYILPILGGWITDHFISPRRAILLGIFLMFLGLITLSLPHQFAISGSQIIDVYIGLGLLVIGSGFFNPNISSLLGKLYHPGDHRRDGGFTIFYISINIGEILGVLGVGSLVVLYGWQSGFFLSAISMMIAFLFQFFLSPKFLDKLGTTCATSVQTEHRNEPKKRLIKEEIDRLKVLLIMGFFTIIFWSAFEQAGGLMMLYLHGNTDRMLGNFEIPSAWFISLNPFFIILFGPLFALLWAKLGQLQPCSPVKFTIALFLTGLGFLCLSMAVLQAEDAQNSKANMLWFVAAYFFQSLGELCLAPVGLSMVTKLAPLRLLSLMMGIWFGFMGLANYFSGLIGSFNRTLGPLSIFSGIAVSCFISAVFLFCLSKKLIIWMHGAEETKISHRA